MNHIYGYPHSKRAEFYKLLLDYDESLERDLADYGTIWYESGTRNLMVGDYGMPYRIVSMVISKNFGFIQRLIENDKIDTNKLEKIGYEKTVCRYDGQYREIVEYSKYESLLMLLSISETPISDLISYLK